MAVIGGRDTGALSGSPRRRGRAARRRRRRRAPPRRRGGPSTPPARRPSRSSGAAYSASTASGASARAVTRSRVPIPALHDSARSATTSTFVSPAASAAASNERALASDALDEHDLGRRQRNGEREPREAGAGAEIGDARRRSRRRPAPARRASRRGERQRPHGRSHGRGSVHVGIEQSEQRSQRIDGRRRKPVPLGERYQFRVGFHVKRCDADYCDCQARRQGGDRARRPRCTSRSRRGRAGTRARPAARPRSSRRARPVRPVSSTSSTASSASCCSRAARRSR